MIYSSYYKKVGKNIKKIRLEKGMKQIDLANKCNFVRQNMQRIEAGKTNLKLKNMLIISKSLEVDITDLFK